MIDFDYYIKIRRKKQDILSLGGDTINKYITYFLKKQIIKHGDMKVTMIL